MENSRAGRMMTNRISQKKLLRLASCVLLMQSLSGCVTSRVEEFMTVQPILVGDEAVVILTNRQDAVVEAERDFSSCIYSELKSDSLNIISENAFKDAIFPWFEPRLAPSKPESLPVLLQNEGVAQKVQDLKVRYMVWIHGDSEVLNKQGMMTCTLSPAGGGCLGVLSWDNSSNYEATVWDVREGQSLGVISAEASGTSVVPAIGLPVPLIARTKSASCKSLANQLRVALAG
jgi:hypothetical protein